MQHIDINTVRPDVIVRSGIIQPFPMAKGPYEVATMAAESFDPAFHRGLVDPSGLGDGAWVPQPYGLPYEPLPEEIAMMAKRLANAMAQGLMPTGVVDQRLMTAARLIMAGQEFTIVSAGRRATVAGSNSASTGSLNRANPAARQARRLATR